MERSSLLLACTLGLAASMSAGASIVQGTTVTIGAESQVAASFVSSSAGATGSVYFLGHAAPGEAITYAASSDAFGLGRLLFSNKGTAAGFSVDLGLFNAGTTLHFAYRITHGVSVAPTGQVTRTDNGTAGYFATESLADADAPTVRMHIEDVVSAGSDMDFNDVRFDVRAVAVPSVGSTALAGIAGLFAAPRRRRQP